MLIRIWYDDPIFTDCWKCAASLVQVDTHERNWHEFRFKMENDLTLVNEKHVAPFLDAEIWLAVNTPAGKDAASHTVQASSCALQALFAFLLLDEA